MPHSPGSPTTFLLPGATPGLWVWDIRGPPGFFWGASTPQTSQAGAQRVGCFIPELHNEAGTAPPPGFQGQKEIRRRWQGAGPGFPQDFGSGKGKSRWSLQAWHGLAPGLAVTPLGSRTVGWHRRDQDQELGGTSTVLGGSRGGHNMRVTTMVRKSS